MIMLRKKKRQFMDSPKNIIVRMPNWIGDVVMATPVLANLRKHYPDAAITVMCQSNVASLLQDDPNVDEIFSFIKPSRWLHRVHHGVLIKRLVQGDYDLGILLPLSFSSAWLFWRGKVQNLLGYQGHWRRFFLDKALSLPADVEKRYLVEVYQKLLVPLEVVECGRSPRLYISKDEVQDARDLLGRCGVTNKHIVVGVNPGAAYGSAKCWLPDRFHQVTEWLLENPAVRVVYFGDSKSRPLVEDICASMSERVINLAGKTSLRELMALIRMCNIFLTNDSGPMHIAAALGIPLVALFGSTNPTKTGPYKTGIVLYKGVECSPCYQRVCPKDFSCMKKISVEEVCQALQKLLVEVKK